jgi:hypothetical protein
MPCCKCWRNRHAKNKQVQKRVSWPCKLSRPKGKLKTARPAAQDISQLGEPPLLQVTPSLAGSGPTGERFGRNQEDPGAKGQ